MTFGNLCIRVIEQWVHEGVSRAARDLIQNIPQWCLNHTWLISTRDCLREQLRQAFIDCGHTAEGPKNFNQFQSEYATPMRAQVYDLTIARFLKSLSATPQATSNLVNHYQAGRDKADLLSFQHMAIDFTYAEENGGRERQKKEMAQARELIQRIDHIPRDVQERDFLRLGVCHQGLPSWRKLFSDNAWEIRDGGQGQSHLAFCSEAELLFTYNKEQRDLSLSFGLMLEAMSVRYPESSQAAISKAVSPRGFTLDAMMTQRGLITSGQGHSLG